MVGHAFWSKKYRYNLLKGNNVIFYDMLGHHMEVYIDDIVVKSRRVNEHVDHLRKSFEMMRH